MNEEEMYEEMEVEGYGEDPLEVLIRIEESEVSIELYF